MKNAYSTKTLLQKIDTISSQDIEDLSALIDALVLARRMPTDQEQDQLLKQVLPRYSELMRVVSEISESVEKEAWGQNDGYLKLINSLQNKLKKMFSESKKDRQTHAQLTETFLNFLLKEGIWFGVTDNYWSRQELVTMLVDNSVALDFSDPRVLHTGEPCHLANEVVAKLFALRNSKGKISGRCVRSIQEQLSKNIFRL